MADYKPVQVGRRRKLMAIPLLLLFAAVAIVGAALVDVPRGIDHSAYTGLLKKYVDDRGLVDYKGWKANAGDMQALRDYIAQLAPMSSSGFATGDEKAAGLINAYNALTIQWILDNYPTASIRSTDDPWGKKRWTVGGRKVSLNEIEHDTLRPQTGYRVHAALVCAARSCPPLQREAFTADKLDAQLDRAMRVWLAREDLNHFLPAERRVELSSIFQWFADDFQKPGLKAILQKYAPDKSAEFLKGDYRTSYQPYHWGLNDQSDLGKNYGTAAKVGDAIRNLFR